MGDKKISELTQLVSPDSSDVLPIVNDGETKQITIEDMLHHISSVETDAIQFNVAYTHLAHSEGSLHWNDEDKTLNVDLAGGNVALQVGQETLIRAKNDEAVTITNGTPVYLFGAVGNNPTVKIASKDVYEKALTIGVATEDILAGQFGYLNCFGLVRDIDTSAWSPGDILWLDNNGVLTNVRPVAGADTALQVLMGACMRSHATEGVIFVKIVYITRLASASDVYYETPSDGDTVIYNAANSRFELSPGSKLVVTTIDNTDSPYSVLNTDAMILADTTAGNIEITLLATASANSQQITIKNIGNGTVTITGDVGELVENSDSVVLLSLDSVTLHPASNTWWIV